METWQRRFLVLTILLLAASLRFYRLDAQSFWNDEGNSARLSERSISKIIEGTASDIHPPLYYLILRGWRELVGDSEFGLRSFSAFAGVLTVAITFALAKELEDRARARRKGRPLALALTSSLLTAVSPPLIYYSQETRMYALLALWAVLSTWLLLRWQQLTINRSPLTIRYSIFYLLIVIAGLYTQYFFAAVLITHNLLILLWLWQNRHRVTPATKGRPPLRPLIQWVAMMLTAALAYLPWLPIFLNQTGGRPEMQGSVWQFLIDASRWLVLGATIQAETAVLPLVAAFLLMIYGLIISRNGIAFLSLTIPVLFMIAAGTTQSQFFKFMTVAVPFFWLLAAMGTGAGGWRLKRFSLQSLISSLLILIVLYGNGRSLQNLYFNPTYARADYRGIAARIEAENHPNAGIILDAPNQWEVFTYYHRDGAPVYPIPTSFPQPDQIDAELTDIAARHDRLYAIFWGDTQRDPERLVERWLDEHTFKTTEEWVGDVRFVTYAVPAEPATEMETAVNLPLGDAITLKGYTLVRDKLTPGDIVQITLFWETAVPLNTRYKVFLHLVDANGQLIAQRDSEPGGGLNLTTRWPPGEIIIDNHGVLIPADLPSGIYKLLIGLYDLTDPNSRLPIQAETGAVDALSVATISISE